MQTTIKEPAPWARGRFWGIVGALFILQAGLLFLFGDRSGPPRAAAQPTVRFRALGASATEDQLLHDYFVGDPSVFPLPNRHGFSGRGWMDQRPPEFQSERQLEPPDWLALDAARLGTNFPARPPGFGPALAALVEQPGRHEDPLPPFLAPEIIATQSVFQLEINLSNRLLGPPPVLTNWPSPLLLADSTVQLAVDSTGEVVATRLDKRSGLAEADADALAKARTLRFRPARTGGIKWGQAVFRWQTSEPAVVSPAK